MTKMRKKKFTNQGQRIKLHHDKDKEEEIHEQGQRIELQRHHDKDEEEEIHEPVTKDRTTKQTNTENTQIKQMNQKLKRGNEHLRPLKIGSMYQVHW